MNQSEIREQNIEKVLETAQNLFLENGVADTSINSIAEHCGLSPMSIYRYFKTKDFLAARVWQMSMNMFYEQYYMPAYRKESSGLTNGYEKFLACTRVYIQYYTEHPEWFAYTREMFQIASRVNEIDEKEHKDENWKGFFQEIPIPLLKALSEGKEDGSMSIPERRSMIRLPKESRHWISCGTPRSFWRKTSAAMSYNHPEKRKT